MEKHGESVQLSSIYIDWMTDVVTDDSAVSKTDHRASVALRDQYVKSAAQGHFDCCSGHSRCTTGRTTATCSPLSHTCLSVTEIVSAGWWLLADVLPGKRPYQWRDTGTDTSDTKRKLVSKKSVSNADACCHGDWGQWMVAMELATWNSGKGMFWRARACVCVVWICGTRMMKVYK